MWSWQPFDVAARWLEGFFGLDSQLRTKLVSSVLTVATLWALRWLALSMVWRQVADVRDRYRWRKGLTYGAVVIGLLLVGRIWVAGLRELTTFLGLLSAGIAIALKDLVANFAGWAFILWRRPFEVGDRIQIGGHSGDVIDVRIFQFTLLEVGNWVEADQSTGRIIHVPNGRVLTEVLANYTKGFQYIWDEVPVLVTFESDWRQAKAILAEVVARHAEHLTEEAEQRVREASRRFMIFYTKLTPIVYTSVRDSGVLLTLRYLCDPRRRRTTGQAIWEDVLTEFAKHPNIDFAYPTTRFYSDSTEGKMAKRPVLPDP